MKESEKRQALIKLAIDHGALRGAVIVSLGLDPAQGYPTEDLIKRLTARAEQETPTATEPGFKPVTMWPRLDEESKAKFTEIYNDMMFLRTMMQDYGWDDPCFPAMYVIRHRAEAVEGQILIANGRNRFELIAKMHPEFKAAYDIWIAQFDRWVSRYSPTVKEFTDLYGKMDADESKCSRWIDSMDRHDLSAQGILLCAFRIFWHHSRGSYRPSPAMEKIKTRFLSRVGMDYPEMEARVAFLWECIQGPKVDPLYFPKPKTRSPETPGAMEGGQRTSPASSDD